MSPTKSPIRTIRSRSSPCQNWLLAYLCAVLPWLPRSTSSSTRVTATGSTMPVWRSSSLSPPNIVNDWRTRTIFGTQFATANFKFSNSQKKLPARFTSGINLLLVLVECSRRYWTVNYFSSPTHGGVKSQWRRHKRSHRLSSDARTSKNCQRLFRMVCPPRLSQRKQHILIKKYT